MLLTHTSTNIRRLTKVMSELCRLSESHLCDVAELERLCFSEPWSEKTLELLLKDGGVGFAVLCDGKAVAYGGMTCVLDEGQITNIATHPHFRRRGFAREVVEALLKYAEKNGISSVFLEVRSSNEAAISLYKLCGFECVGERKNFYRRPTENAVIMKKEID